MKKFIAKVAPVIAAIIVVFGLLCAIQYGINHVAPTYNFTQEQVK